MQQQPAELTQPQAEEPTAIELPEGEQRVTQRK